MKDHDLTWLYGPLIPGPSLFGECRSSNSKGRRMSRAEIVRHSKKPILKKRSLSEIMFQHSISSSLLLKKAVVAKSGKDTTPKSFPFELPPHTRSNTTMLSCKSPTGLETPEGWKKVQFHELVEQCIALATAGDEEHEYQYCSDSDEDMIMMRKPNKRATSKWLPAMKSQKQASVSKTIEKLGHAPLKDIEQLQAVPDEEVIEGISTEEYAALPSQAATSASASLDQDSDEEDDMDGQPPTWLQGRKHSVQTVMDRLSDFKMQQDEVAKETHVHQPYLERRDAAKEKLEVSYVPSGPTKQGSGDTLIEFELPLTQSQVSNHLFKTPIYQQPRDDYFMVDPGMTDGECGDSVDMARSSSQSSTSSNKFINRGIEDAVRRDTQIKQPHLIADLVNIIHDYENKTFESYFETGDRRNSMEVLDIQSLNPFQSSTGFKDTVHQHPEILDAAFHQPYSQYMGNYRPPLRSSTTSPAPSTVSTTPGEMIFSDSGCASEAASTTTSPDPGRRGIDLNKYSLPKDLKAGDTRNVRDEDLYSYDELDEEIAWSQVF
jgi:hypothetical protein